MGMIAAIGRKLEQLDADHGCTWVGELLDYLIQDYNDLCAAGWTNPEYNPRQRTTPPNVSRPLA